MPRDNDALTLVPRFPTLIQPSKSRRRTSSIGRRLVCVLAGLILVLAYAPANAQVDYRWTFYTGTGGESNAEIRGADESRFAIMCAEAGDKTIGVYFTAPNLPNGALYLQVVVDGTSFPIDTNGGSVRGRGRTIENAIGGLTDALNNAKDRVFSVEIPQLSRRYAFSTLDAKKYLNGLLSGCLDPQAAPPAATASPDTKGTPELLRMFLREKDKVISWVRQLYAGDVGRSNPTIPLPSSASAPGEAIRPKPVQTLSFFSSQAIEVQPLQRLQTATTPVATAFPDTKMMPADGAANQASGLSAAWVQQLKARIDAFKKYPAAAKATRAEGVAVVRFKMDRSGHVLEKKVIRGSGSPELDQEALDILDRASPLPAVPSEMAGSIPDFTLPIRFSLNNSSQTSATNWQPYLALCFITVDNRTFLDTKCNVDTDRGTTVIGGGEHPSKYFAYIQEDGRGGIDASWNAGSGSHAQADLGKVTRFNSCWLNKRVRICAVRLSQSRPDLSSDNEHAIMDAIKRAVFDVPLHILYGKSIKNGDKELAVIQVLDGLQTDSSGIVLLEKSPDWKALFLVDGGGGVDGCSTELSALTKMLNRAKEYGATSEFFPQEYWEILAKDQARTPKQLATDMCGVVREFKPEASLGKPAEGAVNK